MDPGYGMVKNSDPISGIRHNISDHVSESLVTSFWLKILKFFLNWVFSIPDPGSGMEKSRSGMEIIIRDKHPGSATLEDRH
jgi:hypothetical protein